MEEVYLSIYCDVFYVADKNVVLVHWKKYCELEQYREPLMKALQVINAHRGCNYVADTRDGFEDNPLDTKWVAEYFMPKAKEYGCSIIYFIIDKDNMDFVENIKVLDSLYKRLDEIHAERPAVRQASFNW